MKNIAIFIVIASFLSCSNTSEKLKSENIKLNNKINSLKSELDSLKNLPSVQFEKIISKDISLNSLRIKSTNEYILPIKQNELKTSDSLLSQNYLNFSKKYPNSYFSMYAIDRIKSIENKQITLKINQIIGKWNWKMTTNTFLQSTGDKDEQIQFYKNKTVRFFKNGKLVSKEKYKLSRNNFGAPQIQFSEKGNYMSIIKHNGLLILTRGNGICEDCAKEVYKKVE